MWLTVLILLSIGLIQAYFFYSVNIFPVAGHFVKGYKFALGIAGMLALSTHIVVFCTFLLDSIGYDTGLLGEWVYRLGRGVKELYLSCGGTEYPEPFDTTKWDKPGQSVHEFFEQERLKSVEANERAKLDPRFTKVSESHKWHLEATTFAVRILIFFVVLGATAGFMTLL